MYRNAGVGWAMLSDGDAPVAWKLRVPTSIQIHTYGLADLDKRSIQRSSLRLQSLEEEAVVDTCSTHYQHPHWNQGKALPFPQFEALKSSARPCSCQQYTFAQYFTCSLQNSFLSFWSLSKSVFPIVLVNESIKAKGLVIRTDL